MARPIRSILRRVSWCLPATLLALLLLAPGARRAMPAAAQTSADVLVTQNPALNSAILTNSSGMTLYFYSRDTSGVSNCNGQCATSWPPAQASGSSPVLDAMAMGTLTVITRADGTQQLAYNGMPLYAYSKDANPGDTTGQGVGGVWSVATP